MGTKKQRKLREAVILGIVVLLLAFGTAAIFIGYRQFTDVLTNQYKDNVSSIALEAASMVDASMLRTYLETDGAEPGYASTEARLRDLCNNMNATFIYVVLVDTDDYGHIHFVFDVLNDDCEYSQYEIGKTKETTNEEYRQHYKAMFEDGLDKAVVVRDRGVIETQPHVTGVVPLRTADGTTQGLLAVEMPMTYLSSARTGFLKSIVVTVLILIALSGTGWFIYLKKRLLTPISDLDTEAKRFAEENTPAAVPLSSRIPYNDELGSLAATIDDMEIRTLEYFNSLTAITAEKERIGTELSLATKIQADMLPNIFPAFPEHNEFDIFAVMDPAKEVGGDFYDMFMVDDEHLAFVIADVSGKSIPAALFMVIAKTLIKNFLLMGLPPEEAFERANAQLCDGNASGLFVTAWLGILDIHSGELVYVNAGHNPPLLLNNGAYSFRKNRTGFVLAALENIKYRHDTLKLEPGDRLFLYTDGVTEATDTRNTLYGEKRLHSYLNSHKTDTLVGTLKGVQKDIDRFVGGAEQFDDITMLIVEYKNSSGI